METINVFDYEILAKARMDPVSWDFYAGGSDDEITMRANQADFTRIRLPASAYAGRCHPL